ncbi:hypothetical protein HHI36_000595 [Cryptolaemus montrouzieri]|uniref:Gustatory receptor n=1 Tax=Cryptolaemus montrouzieri TaxID=559131 RepID=A0ABD2P632_9CUCU
MIPIFPFKGKCQHLTENYDGDTIFWTSKLRAILPFGLIFTNLFGTVMYMYNMLKVCEGQERLECLLELHDHLLIINTILSLFLLGLRISERAEELNYISHLLKTRKFYGFKNIICRKCGRYIYCINHVNIPIATAFVLIFGLASFANKGTKILNYHDFCMFVSQGVQVAIASQISQKLVVMRIIYRAVDRSVRQRFKTVNRKGGTCLKEDLPRIIHLYLDLKMVTNKICEYVDPMVLLWLTSHIALSVFNFYFLVQLMNIRPVYLIIFEQAKTVVTLMVIISIFTDCQQLADQVSKFDIKLFKGDMWRIGLCPSPLTNIER